MLSDEHSADIVLKGQMATCWSASSTARDSYYAIDSVGNVIHEVKFDHELKASLVNVRARDGCSLASSLTGLVFAEFHCSDWQWRHRLGRCRRRWARVSTG